MNLQDELNEEVGREAVLYHCAMEAKRLLRIAEELSTPQIMALVERLQIEAERCTEMSYTSPKLPGMAAQVLDFLRE